MSCWEIKFQLAEFVFSFGFFAHLLVRTLLSFPTETRAKPETKLELKVEVELELEVEEEVKVKGFVCQERDKKSKLIEAPLESFTGTQGGH